MSMSWRAYALVVEAGIVCREHVTEAYLYKEKFSPPPSNAPGTVVDPISQSNPRGQQLHNVAPLNKRGWRGWGGKEA